MASRKKCESCNKNFGKTAFYDHLPCKHQDQGSTCTLERESGEYVFCDHCCKRVAKPTYYEHKRMISSTDSEEVVTQRVEERKFDQFYDCDDEMMLIDENQSQNLQLDDEDQEFFCESDGLECEDSREADIVDDDVDIDNGNGSTACDIDDDEVFEHCDDNQESDNVDHEGSQDSSESRAFILFLMLWQTMYKISDRGLVVLLTFLQSFLYVIGKLASCDGIMKFAETLPVTIYMAKVYLGIGQDNFDKFVVCPKCMTLYEAEECTVKKSNGRIVSKKCTHVNFPNHPQRSKRRQCGALLMKKMRSKSGTFFLHPKKVYCFRKVTESLKSILTRPGFVQKCESWREREPEPDCMGDVYEGKVWQEFLDYDGSQYFSSIGNLGVMLNVDWFQPYKHTNHSCGVLYLVLMNLPREERFKQENVMIVGIIPGPKEPKGNINTFLQPLVDELSYLWDGVILEDVHLPGGRFKVRVALLALCCDIPAARKCGGFAGHSARKGCNKCFKTFPCSTFGAKPDFSGFDMDNWEKRTNELHRIHAESTLSANCPTRMKAIVRETGAKYTALLQLPYYDAVRFVVIDPMHNLFLGVAKYMLKMWMTNGILTERDFQIMQKRVNAVVPPPEIGRIPTKIETGFSGFTADQWKNWVCYYSIFALKGILPSKHYDVWLNFVDACRLICCHLITQEQCSEAGTKILKFCKMFEKLYGKEMCTPNLHLSCHLAECILDYGPVYSFWCFSFERYNGILGSYHKNNNNIGVQLMRKFLRDNELQQMEFPQEYEDFKGLLAEPQTGTLGEMNIVHQFVSRQSLAHGEQQQSLAVPDIDPLPPVKRIALDAEDASDLEKMYHRLYPEQEIVSVLRICDSFSRVLINRKMVRCCQTTSVKARCFDGEMRPGKVCRFLSHDVIIKRDGKRRKVRHVVAEVEWFEHHPERNWCPSPVEVWSTAAEPDSEFSYIPVSNIQQLCMTVKYKVRFCHGFENVNVVIPLIGRFSHW